LLSLGSFDIKHIMEAVWRSASTARTGRQDAGVQRLGNRHRRECCDPAGSNVIPIQGTWVLTIRRNCDFEALSMRAHAGD